MPEELDIIEFYRKELKRIAWRLRRKERSRLKHEVPLENNPNLSDSNSFTERIEQKILVQQLFKSIPSAAHRRIIYEIYFNRKTETQVANEMQISQQVVNRWKKKTLATMRRQVSSSIT